MSRSGRDHRGRARRVDGKALTERFGIHVAPPGIDITHQHLQHAVLREFLHIEILQDEAEAFGFEHRDVVVLMRSKDAIP